MTGLNSRFAGILRNDWIVGAMIVVVTIVLYSNTLKYDMLYNYDDDAYINDISIKELSAGHTATYFSTYYLGMYQPIPVLSYAMLLDVFPGSVAAQRVTNLLIHCLNALLVFLLLYKITKVRAVGWLSALLFAIHPMHVESVSWLATRGNLMYSCFFLLALLFFVKWRQENKARQLLLLVIFFILSLFSKVTAVTLPLVFLLYDIVTSRPFNRKSIAFYLPLVLLSAVFIRVGILASGSFGHISELNESYSLPDRAFLILNALWLYIYKALLPINQSVIYLYPWKVGGHLPMMYYVAGSIGLVILMAGVWLGWKNRDKVNGKALLLGLLFFLITISIVLPLKWSRTILIAERYTYIPYIGLFGAMLMIGHQYFNTASKWLRNSLIGVLAVVLVLYSVAAYQRNAIWQSPLTLFKDVVTKNRSNAEVSMGYYNCGNEFLRLGKLDDAVSVYTAAINVHPGYSEALYNRGLTYFYMGNNPGAIDDFSSAISLNDSNPEAYMNRGIAYRSTSQYALALADFDLSIQKQPTGLAYFNRGALYYFNLGDSLQACEDWKKAYGLGYAQAGEVLAKFCNQ